MTRTMRLLLANPNTGEAMTARMAEVARAVAPPGVEIVAVTAPRGFPYIASRAEAQIGGAILLETIAEHAGSVDAVIVAAFGDPGVKAARELFDVPVVGMAEAAAVTACLLGERFAIVTFTPLMSRWYLDCMREAGVEARCTGVVSPARRELVVDAVADTMQDELAALARRCVVEDGADVVILGGAPLAGLAPRIAHAVPGVLLDPIAVAVGQAYTLALAAPSAALRRRHARPAGKPSTGLPAALAGRMAADADAVGGASGRAASSG